MGYTTAHLMRIAWKAGVVLAGLMLAGLMLAGARSAAAKGDGAACKVDADCVLVPDDCCGCRAGGKQKALPKKDLAAYERSRQARCTAIMCPALMSLDPTCSARSAVCKEGKCTLGL